MKYHSLLVTRSTDLLKRHNAMHLLYAQFATTIYSIEVTYKTVNGKQHMRDVWKIGHGRVRIDIKNNPNRKKKLFANRLTNLYYVTISYTSYSFFSVV